MALFLFDDFTWRDLFTLSSQKQVHLTNRQQQLFKALKESCQQLDHNTITYETDWLGYLPYGQYQWVQIGTKDITASLPADFTLGDLYELARVGLTKTISSKKEDDFEQVCFELVT